MPRRAAGGARVRRAWLAAQRPPPRDEGDDWARMALARDVVSQRRAMDRRRTGGDIIPRESFRSRESITSREYSWQRLRRKAGVVATIIQVNQIKSFSLERLAGFLMNN